MKSVKNMPTSPSSSETALSRAVLGRSQWFSLFGADQLDAFSAQGELNTYARGTTLCRRGDTITALGVVIQGVVDISTTGSNGRRHIATYLEPGQVMSLIPILDDEPALHDASAHEDVTLLLIPKPLFLQTIDAHPGLARLMAKVLCRRSRFLYESVANNALLTLRARCARLLLSLLSAYGLPREHGVTLSLKLSQEEFADMLGCTRQSVNRELKQMEREGTIQMSYSHFTIKDEAALHTILLA